MLSKNEKETIKELIKLALTHIGHGTDSFVERSLSFYKLIKTHKFISFGICEEWELAFAFLEDKDGDAEISLSVYGWGMEMDREMWLKVEHKLFGFNERNAHLAFLKLIGGLQEELRKVKED